MKRAILIFLWVSSVVTPNFAADGDQPAVKKRVVRSFAAPATSEPLAKPAPLIKPDEGVSKLVTPLSLEVPPQIIEPPIPDQHSNLIVEEAPIPDLENGKIDSMREVESAKALGIAQTYYRRSLWESAAEWYQRSLDWDPGNVLAAEGFVMSAFHSGLYNYAYRESNKYSESMPGMKTCVIEAATEQINQLFKQNRIDEAGEILDHFPLEERAFDESREKLGFLQSRQTESIDPGVHVVSPFNNGNPDRAALMSTPRQQSLIKAAEEDYRSQKFMSSLWNLQQAEREGPLPRNAALLKGWNLYSTGQLDESASLFEKLYKTQADAGSARGIVASLRKKGDHARLGQLVAERGGILAVESKAADTAAFDFRDTTMVSNE